MATKKQKETIHLDEMKLVGDILNRLNSEMNGRYIFYYGYLILNLTSYTSGISNDVATLNIAPSNSMEREKVLKLWKMITTPVLEFCSEGTFVRFAQFRHLLSQVSRSLQMSVVSLQLFLRTNEEFRNL